MPDVQTVSESFDAFFFFFLPREKLSVVHRCKWSNAWAGTHWNNLISSTRHYWNALISLIIYWISCLWKSDFFFLGYIYIIRERLWLWSSQMMGYKMNSPVKGDKMIITSAVTTADWLLTDQRNAACCKTFPTFWGLWCHVGVVPLLGSVPAYYREVYEAICCRTDERVQVEVFQRLLQRTDLSKAVLGQVRGLYTLLYCEEAATGNSLLKATIINTKYLIFKKSLTTSIKKNKIKGIHKDIWVYDIHVQIFV